MISWCFTVIIRTFRKLFPILFDVEDNKDAFEILYALRDVTFTYISMIIIWLRNSSLNLNNRPISHLDWDFVRLPYYAKIVDTF